MFPTMKYAVLVIRLGLGALFVFSGSIKVLDARSFMAALPYYHVPQWMASFGILLPPLEVFLGGALILGFAPRWINPATVALVFTFSILIINGMLGGELKSCGCFGRLLEQSPGGALVKNVIIAALAGFLWWRESRGGASSRWRVWQVWLAAAIFLISGTLTGYTAHKPLMDNSIVRIGDFFPVEGFRGDIPDFEGEQLVFIFTTDCSHCWDSVANVKGLAADTSYRLMGITGSDDLGVEDFIDYFDPNFPIYSYDPEMFEDTFRTWPALYYLEDGVIRGKTEEFVPSLRTLQEEYLPSWWN